MLLLTLFGCNRTHNDDLKDEYLVTFNYNYQDSPENYEVLVRSGEKVEKPSDPNRETHTFEGWFITEEEFDFETPIIEAITLVAKWKEIEVEPDTFSVTFNSDGGIEIETIKVVSNDLVKKPLDPTKNGYEFLGWFINGEEFDFETPITESITLVAKWDEIIVEVNKFIVTLIYGYDDKPNDNIIVEEGNYLTLSEEPTRAGHQFLGWYYYDSLFDLKTPITKNITLSARWKENEVPPIEGEKEVDIYYLNDLHGALSSQDAGIGLDYFANVIMAEQEDKDVLFITGGDILQGQLLSNHFYGESIIFALNEMKLDAFVIGNHEFDWGLEKVLGYFNGENEIQADFPFLGANVFLKETDKLPNGLEPYTIVNKNGLKILIIGTIGYGLETSIDGGLVKDYYFADPVPIVSSYIEEFKDEVDVVVAVHHGADNYYNTNVAHDGADVILNGHTHQAYVRDQNGVPVLQSGSSGSYLGKVEVSVDDNKSVGAVAKNLSPQDDKRLYQNREEITTIIEYYAEQITYKYDTILISKQYYSVSDLSFYIAKVMREKTDADIAFHNSGGTRTYLSSGEAISEATVLNIFPFDNFIITVNLKGSEINSFLNSGYGGINDKRPGISNFKSNETYKVAVHSYTFNFADNPFMYGDNIVHTGIVLREAIVEVLKSQKSHGYQYFDINSPITFDIQETGYKWEEKELATLFAKKLALLETIV